MDLYEFTNHGGSLEMTTAIVKTNKLDVNKYHKRNGLAKLDYDYNDRQKLAHYKGQYFDLMKSEYTEEKPQYVVTFTDSNANIVKKIFIKLENAMNYIDGLDDDDFTLYDEDHDDENDDWDCDGEADDKDADELDNANDEAKGAAGSNNDNGEAEDDDSKADSDDSDWVDPDEEEDD